MGVVPKRKRPVTVTVAALTVIVGSVFLQFFPLIYGVSLNYMGVIVIVISVMFSIGLLRLYIFARSFLGVIYIGSIAGNIYYFFMYSSIPLDIIRLFTVIAFAAIYFILMATPSARGAFKKGKTLAKNNVQTSSLS